MEYAYLGFALFVTVTCTANPALWRESTLPVVESIKSTKDASLSVAKVISSTEFTSVSYNFV